MSVEIDVKVYANYVVEKLIRLKDSNKSVLTRNEVDAINDACNLIDHNLEELKRV